jgi:triacylglycerol lipase
MRLVSALICAFAVAAPAAADDYARTRHPIVLVHGMFGFDRAFGQYDYFLGIPHALEAGGATVYLADLPTANSTTVRGEELLLRLDRLAAATGAQRFNLIAHSQGALDARYVASVRPDLVASVTSIGGPNRGTPVADASVAMTDPSTWLGRLQQRLFDAFASVLELVSSNPQPVDVRAGMLSLTTTAVAQFNALHPQGVPVDACGEGEAVVDGVHYYAFGGTAIATNLVDPTDLMTSVGNLSFAGADNDGQVGRCSSHLGDVIRDNYPWNHWDEVNQVAGLRGWFTPDPVAVYRAHANRLKSAGL